MKTLLHIFKACAIVGFTFVTLDATPSAAQDELQWTMREFTYSPDGEYALGTTWEGVGDIVTETSSAMYSASDINDGDGQLSPLLEQSVSTFVFTDDGESISASDLALEEPNTMDAIQPSSYELEPFDSFISY